MSMQTVEYQGYGIDHGQFKSNNPKFNELMEAIIDSDEFYDAMMDGEKVAMATAVNTDSFECLIYIPAVIPVSSDTGTIKIYDQTTANNIIFESIKDVVTSNKFGEDLGSKSPLSNFLAELKQFIDKNANFSYEQDWTDLV